MALTDYELAADAAKEIIVKMMDNPNNISLFLKGGSMPDGIALADHIGDCYQALYKKILSTLKAL